MKRREALASGMPNDWLTAQWIEAAHTLEARPESRRGPTLISDEALKNCLEVIRSASILAAGAEAKRLLTAAQ
ncbi:hypothetical protein [Bosea thiooxidans]